MRLLLNCVGTLKDGPERDLVIRYTQRASAAGKSLGITGIEIREIQESRAKHAAERKVEEAKLLRTLIHEGTKSICFDQHGKMLTSVSFSELIVKMRGEALNGLALIIGGPDGLDEVLMSDCFLKISFGAMTWPHQLARIMVAEQIYRAITIINRHPYHRS